MLKFNVVQRFFSIFFCFLVIICDVSIPNKNQPTYYEKHQTYSITSDLNRPS